MDKKQLDKTQFKALWFLLTAIFFLVAAQVVEDDLLRILPVVMAAVFLALAMAQFRRFERE